MAVLKPTRYKTAKIGTIEHTPVKTDDSCNAAWKQTVWNNSHFESSNLHVALRRVLSEKLHCVAIELEFSFIS